jgi:hypothetical protein
MSAYKDEEARTRKGLHEPIISEILFNVEPNKCSEMQQLLKIEIKVDD